MIAVQIGVIVFLIFVLAVIYRDEHKRRKSERKSAKLDRFWKTGEERRKSIRITSKVDVLYEVASGKQTQKHSSISRNISLGGMSLAMNEKLSPGTRLDLRLNITENAKPILVQGRVVWTKEISGKFAKQTKQRLFAAGIKFIQMKPADEAILGSFISQRIRNAAKQN